MRLNYRLVIKIGYSSSAHKGVSVVSG